ncbi:hypothetical protein CRE_13558 [Caenorhabditis remanei]|uniref:Uncharacterized protein n=1 Tax=Caenorhabditis remanei TaxID=31234 RepID=E3MRB0_CAERE|nr:hypothetical protein CRE_13558 [Caenorhabditis remanei]
MDYCAARDHFDSLQETENDCEFFYGRGGGGDDDDDFELDSLLRLDLDTNDIVDALNMPRANSDEKTTTTTIRGGPEKNEEEGKTSAISICNLIYFTLISVTLSL